MHIIKVCLKIKWPPGLTQEEYPPQADVKVQADPLEFFPYLKLVPEYVHQLQLKEAEAHLIISELHVTVRRRCAIKLSSFKVF